MEESSLPHFIKREGSGSGSSRHSGYGEEEMNCYSLDHLFHQQLYSYIKAEQSSLMQRIELIKQGSFHVSVPDPTAQEAEIAKTLESELYKLGKGVHGSMNGLRISGGD